MNNKVVTSMISAAVLTGAAYAGPAPIVAEEESNCGSWCDTLKTIGTVYSSTENPYIQKVRFFGRAQLQYGYIDGNDADDNDFNADFDEFRRFRLGGEVKFLNGFKLKANANFVRDLSPVGLKRDFGYQSFDQAKISYTKSDVFGLDSGTITYGRYKVAVGAEQHTSSKKIKTVERSALANKLTTARPTGASIDASLGNWSGTFGVFSTSYDLAGVANGDASGALYNNWDKNTAFYVSSKLGLEQGDVLLDFLYNDQHEPTLDSVNAFSYQWAFSAAYLTKVADWDVTVNAIVGDNGDQSASDREGTFYGFVAQGSTDIIEDKLEFVTRYAYQGSQEDNGIKTNSRYFRNATSGGQVNGGLGSNHHSIYAGLNWYLCGHNSKFMTGVEYENLDTTSLTADATTLWAAYRMYF